MSRIGTVRHIASCRALLCAYRFVFDEASWEALPEMFNTLMSLGAMQLCLVENRGSPGEAETLAFCATIFVSDAFCREVCTTLPPYLGSQVVQRYILGKLPVLDRDQIAFANARAGVNVIICYGGIRSDYLSNEQVLAVREKMDEAFRLVHHGYRLNELLCAPIGEETLRSTLGAGYRLRRDYCHHYQSHGISPPDSLRRPSVAGLTKEEALANYGSRASGLFIFTPPRFFFARSEQSILHHALAGETDEGIADNMAISHWTVKKRWRAIYERIAAIDRELLPASYEELGTESRGAERRRHLIAYLRQHLEELRPCKG